MPKQNCIFISYRRKGNQYTVGRIYQNISNVFGSNYVFKDIYDIDYGNDFREQLNIELDRCQILLAIIGPSWLKILNENRYSNFIDYVQLEIETALIRNIRVIPVLIDGANIPPINLLPKNLENLCYRQGISIRPDPDFSNDIQKLINSIKKHTDMRNYILSHEKLLFDFQYIYVNQNGLESHRYSSRAYQFKEYINQSISIDMVFIPGGKFKIGASTQEDHSKDRERPQCDIYMSDFMIGKFPITQIQWRVVSQQLPKVEIDLAEKPSFFQGDNRPVESISWCEAIEFCKRLSCYTGRDYHLPSEAEWEYACRAGSNTPFHFGENISSKLANYRGTKIYRSGKAGIYRQQTTPVGSFKFANKFGLFDMHGNVLEWCADQWHKNYIGIPSDGKPWLTKTDTGIQVIRGGSFHSYPHYCRSSCRMKELKTNVFDSLGFRVACSDF